MEIQEDISILFRRKYLQVSRQFVNLGFQGFNRDDRRMKSIGLEVRPLFLERYEVGHGDWSLLNEVRKWPLNFQKG